MDRRLSPSLVLALALALALPAKVDPGGIGEIFWLRTRLSSAEGIPAALAESMPSVAVSTPGLWFLSGKAGVAFELYANGVRLGSRGSLHPDFDIRTTQATAIHAPANVALWGEIALALRCSYRGREAAVSLYSLGDEATELVSSVLRLRELATRTHELSSSLALAREEGGAPGS